jgi:GNAT superfamily N-acetyltransferase
MEKTMTLRSATEADLPAVFALWEGLMKSHASKSFILTLREGYEAPAKALLLERLQNPQCNILLAENDSGKTVGMTTALLKPAPPVGELALQGYIAETFVDPEARNQQIGQRLFEAAKAWFRLQGADHILLQVSPQNPDGLRFWERMGFEPASISMVMRVDASPD